MNSGIYKQDIESLVILALKEDLGDGDVTSQAIFNEESVSCAEIMAKDSGVLCGVDMVRNVYGYIDRIVSVKPAFQDGDRIRPGDSVMVLEGRTLSLLSGERTSLNFLQRMTGIATRTARIVSLLKGTGIKLLDTRKTLPGFRGLDKYSVKTGGGANHRMGLYDMVMIKDNHIQAAGGIEKAVEMARAHYGTKYIIEVEAANLDEVRAATASGPDIIMLDNMDTDMMRNAVEIINKKAKIEVSGNINEESILRIRDLQVDYISMGSLTHSVVAFDLSMKFK